jgi:hypothetical protein
MLFRIVVVDSDNGSEFVNEDLLDWREKRKITVTRACRATRTTAATSSRRTG